jgi:nucleoside-diphosphate-sugar epimerase
MVERILIAGCGDVGNALAKRALAEGNEVWGVRRNPSALADGVRPWSVDLTEPTSLESPPASFDYVFYTASADRRDEESYRAIYVDGLRNLLQALEQTGSPLKRVFFTSSTAVYGQDAGEWVDEGSDTEPDRFNGRILLEAEAIMRSIDGGVVVRLSGIYGPGRTRLIEKVWRQEASATQSWTNRIHVEDCGATLHHLMQLANPAGLYLASDDAPTTMAEVVMWMSERLDVPAPDPMLGPHTNKRCRNARLRATGFRFAYPSFREGYAPIVRDFLRDAQQR